MKKFYTILLAAMCLFTTISAETSQPSSSGESGTTQVKYNVASSFTWEIHTDIDFGKNAGVNQTVNKTAELSDDSLLGVRVNSNVIPDSTKLVISMDSNNTFKVVNGNTSLSYTVSKTSGGDALEASDSILEVPAGTNTGSQALYFELDTTNGGSSEVAGYIFREYYLCGRN